MAMRSIRNIAFLFFLSVPVFSWAQKSFRPLNQFRVTYVLNGKVKDLDTNFTIRVFDRDRLLCEAKAYAILAESGDPKEKYQRFSSLVQLPVLPLDPLYDLTAEIETGEETIRWEANLWEYQDSLKFDDAFDLMIYKFSKPKKFRQTLNDNHWFFRFRKEIKAPDKEGFPFIVVGWLLWEEDLEMEMEVRN